MTDVAQQVHQHAYARAGADDAPWGGSSPSRALVTQHARRQLQTRGEAYADPSRCLSADFELLPPTPYILYQLFAVLFIGPVPIQLVATASLVYWIDFALSICISDRTIVGTLIPGMALEASVFGGYEIPIFARAGLEILVRLMEIRLYPSASLSVKNGLEVCLAFDVALVPVSIEVRGVLSFFICIKFCRACFKVFGKKICVPLPCGLKFCPGMGITIWRWGMAEIRKNLFVICNQPPDSTPPIATDAYVKAKQIDAESVHVSWGGFRDEESNVKGYTACLGTSPGAQDISACQFVELDKSILFTLLPLADKDWWVLYASVLARNGEGLETLLVDRFTVDDSAPIIVDILMFRAHDGNFTRDPLIKHSDTQSLRALIGVVEPNPEEHIAVSVVEVAVGLSPLSFQDAADWTEVLQDFNSNHGYADVTISGLTLQHGVEYYVHVRSTNTIGLQSVATAPTRVFIDQTPAVGRSVWVQNGASVMLEYLLEWMPFSDGNPEFSATAWTVSPVWEFDDPESEIVEYHVQLLDANGSPDVAIAEAYVDADQTTVTLDGFSLPHLSAYEVKVRAKSDANLWGEIVSGKVTIDITRPQTRQVLDLAQVPTEGLLSLVPQFGTPAAKGLYTPGLLTPAQISEVELDFVTSLEELRVGFAAWDEESGIKHVMVAAGTAPGSTSVLDWTDVEVNGRRHVRVPLPEGTSLARHVRYYVAVSGVNGAGLLALWSSSDGIMIDDTEPVCVEYRVRDGTHRLLDSDFTSLSTEVTAQWRSAMFDLESLISHFRVTLEDAESGLVLAGPMDVGKATKVTFKELSLGHTQRIRTVVTAVNRAGTERDCATDGMLVDLTGPVPTDHPAGQVWDGNSALFGYEDADLQYTWATRSAFGAWTKFVDPESGINNYWLWTETMDGAILSSRVWVHPSLTEWTMPIPTQAHGDQYRIVVRAENRAGSFKDYRSDGIEVDVTPPSFTSPVEFRIPEDATGLEPHIITSEDAKLTIAVRVQDPESGMLRCRYALGTYPDGSDLTGVVTSEVRDMPSDTKTVVERTRGGQTVCLFDGSCVDIPTTTHTVTTDVAIDEVLNKDVQLLNHFTFYAWVVCINNADSFVRVRAPRALIVDARAPSAGLVFDGLAGRQEVDFSPSNETFAANWRWWRDHETGIRFFEAGVGTSPGAVDVHDWVQVGTRTTAFFNFFGDKQLTHGQKYFTSVRATDNAGHTTVGSSDGVVIDITPTEEGVIEHGLWDTPVRKYTNRFDLVLMRWSGVTDAESGVTSYEFGLSSTPYGNPEDGGKPDIVPLVYIGVGDQAAVIDVELEHAHVYYGAVRSQNGVGLRRIVHSRGVLVDLTPPKCDVWDGTRGTGDFDFSTEGVPRVHIQCTDLESGAARLRWGLGTIQGWDDAVPMTDAPFAALDVPPHLDRIFNDTIGPYHTSPWRMMDANVASLLPVLDGVRYYGVVYVENGAGSWVWRVTDGQVHDSSPPAVVFGPRDVLATDDRADVTFSTNTTHWGVRFRVSDPHTGVANVTVQFVTNSDGSNEQSPDVPVTVLDEVELPVLDTVYHVLRRLSTPLEPGRRSWVRIVSSNVVGLSSVTTSDGWIPDVSAPKFTVTPTDGVVPGSDAAFQSVAGAVSACWEAEDAESQVDQFFITARRLHDPHTTLVGWSPVPRSSSSSHGVHAVSGLPFVSGVTCAWVSGFEVEQGESYMVLVQAHNPLGLVSQANTSGVLVDWTPPVIGRVTVGDDAASGVDAVWQTQTSVLRMAWTNVTEADSGIAGVQAGLGTRPGLDDVVAREDVVLDGPLMSGQHVFSGLSLRDGAQYFVTLWATNVLGLTTVRSSPGVRIDSSPPVFYELPHMLFVPQYSFPVGFNEQDAYPTAVAGGSVIVPVTSFLDVHSGIATASIAVLQSEFEIGHEPDGLMPHNFPLNHSTNGRVLVPPTPFGISEGLFSVAVPEVVLTNNTWLWVEVNATNGVGMLLQQASRAVLISTETLSAGYVNDGFSGYSPFDDVSYQSSSTSYSARWAGFTDPKSDIWYSVALGSAPGLADIRDWQAVGHATAVDILQDFEVPIGTVVYATVLAENDVGVQVNASSDGLIMGSFPPDLRFVGFGSPSPLAGPHTTPPHVLYVSTSPVVVMWNVSDAQGVQDCHIQVRDQPSLTGGAVLLQATVGAEAALAGLLEFDVVVDEGQAMYAHVVCTNVRNQSSTLQASEWAVVETTPPQPGTVVDGAASTRGDVDITANGTSAAAHWMHFIDMESHIIEFSACLGTVQEPCAVGTSLVGARTDVAFDNIALEDGVTYLWTVNATSGAGVMTSARSNGFTVDLSPPNATQATVAHAPLDAESANALTSVDGGALGVWWDGFADEVSGIDHFLVFLGWTAGSDDVAPSVRVPAWQQNISFAGLEDVLSVGGRVFATVTAVDHVGWSSTVHSRGILVDTTPPIQPSSPHNIIETHINSTALAGANPDQSGADVDILGSTELRVVWGNFTDRESGVVRYEVRVEDHTQEPPSVVLDWSSVGLRTTFVHASLNLLHAHTYRISVRGVNGVGLYSTLRSDGVSVDLQPPAPGHVEDGYMHAAGDVELTNVVAQVSAHWTGFQSDATSIDHFEWCVGTSPGKSDVVACHDVGHAVSATARFTGQDSDPTSLDLQALVATAFGPVAAAAAVAPDNVTPDGLLSAEAVAAVPVEKRTRLLSYYSTVTAVSEVGLRTTSYSNGVRVDVMPPATGVVIDAASPQHPDTAVQTSLSTLWASWFGFVDMQTAITHFELSVGSGSGSDDDVLSCMVVPATASNYTVHGLDLANGMTYFVTVAAFDEAGNMARNTSSGVLVDATPPDITWVKDSDPTGDDPGSVRSTGANSTVTIAWAAVDAESGIAGYEVQLCPALLGASGCVLNWTSVPVSANPRITLDSPELVSGVRYIATVRATSVSGVSSTASSDGFIVDATPPSEGEVVPVSPLEALAVLNVSTHDQWLPTHSLQGSWDLIAAQWRGFTDAESGIASFSVCVGTTPLGSDLVPCLNVGLVFLAVVNASAASPYANSGDSIQLRADRGNFTAFYVTVLAHSGANLTTSAVSAAVQVDASPPVTGFVTHSTTTGGTVEGVETRTTGLSYVSHPSRLCVVAEGFHDPETAIASWSVCVGSLGPGSCNLQPFMYAPPEDPSAFFASQTADAFNDDAFVVLCARDVALTHHQTVWMSVTATNGAGVTSYPVTPDYGVMVVLEDPPVGTVVDALLTAQGRVHHDAVDVDLYGQRRSVGALWYGFKGGVAPIVKFEVAVCGTASGCMNPDNPLSFFADVGLVTNTTFAALTLVEGETYLWHVRATDASGRTSTATSDGFVVDSSPPVAGVVHVVSLGVATATLTPGGVPITDAALSMDEAASAAALVARGREGGAAMWHAGFAPMHVMWSGFGDPESGVASFEVCVSSAATMNGTIRGDVFACQSQPATARYVYLSTAQVNATFVAHAQAQADAAAAASARDDELDLVVDPETGVVNTTANASDVRAAFTAFVKVRACNAVGHCTTGQAPPVAVDMSPPVAGTITTSLNGTGVEEVARSETHHWEATWEPFVDTESGVAYYTAGVWDETDGVYALPEAHVGVATGFNSSQLELVHSHVYRTIVTAYNNAGLSFTAVSNQSTVVDLTPPGQGWVFDVFDLDDEEEEGAVEEDVPPVDADFGDAEAGSLEAAWGGWVDEESGIVTFEWAVMMVDPRAGNLVSAASPGQLLRAAVTQFLTANQLSVGVPAREYGTGRASLLFEVDNGVMITDWLEVGNATSAFREDVDLVTGMTYVVLVRITNGAGLVTMASSDGIVFDQSDPCIGTPHAGYDPDVVPQYLNRESELAAVWPASIDPLHQPQAVRPFVCLAQQDADVDPSAAANQTASEGSGGDTPVDVVDVPVVPVSFMEWQLRKLRIVDASNDTETAAGVGNASSITDAAAANGEDSGLIQVGNVTGLDIVNDTSPVNATDLQSDETVPNANNQTDSVVVMSLTQAGPRYASPWSGCCSSYDELNPTVLNQEWDWRPIHSTKRGFGHDLALAHHGRFVVVGGAGSATVFDTKHPSSTQRTFTVMELETAAGINPAVVNSDSVVWVAADHIVALVTTQALTVVSVSSAHSSPSDLRRGDAQVLASLPASHAVFTFFIDGATFAGVSFAWTVACHDNLVAVTLDGVHGSSSARGVVVLQATATGVVRVGATFSTSDATFGGSVGLAVPPSGELDAVLLVSSPSRCAGFADPAVVDLSNHGTDCDAASSAAGPIQFYAVDAGASTVTRVGAVSSTDITGASSPSPSFGISLAASSQVAVISDPGALNGTGQIGVVDVDASGSPRVLCTLNGLVAGGGFGYSVSVVSAEHEGVPGSVNTGTALLLVGAPSSNLAAVVRVNVSAASGVAGAASDNPDVCRIVAVVRQALNGASEDDDDVPRLYGAGTSVAIGGGAVIFSSPYAQAWPNDGNSAMASADARGRVFGATYCWAGQVRAPATAATANVPSVCLSCDVDAGEWSSGGVSSVCEDCGDRVCRSFTGTAEDFWFSAVNTSAPLENGEDYQVDVTAVSRSGRRNTQSSPPFTVDWTPPETGEVFDAYVGNSSGCTYCANDLDVNTNATYLSVSWCCGWQDLESGIASYSVSFGTSLNTTDDIMGWTDVGLAESFTLENQVLVTGQWYYACVVALNNAGLWSAPMCTDGFVYDASPPSMLFVNDGLARGQDMDAQSFLNLAFASYAAQDNETTVMDYVWSIGSTPGATDLLAEERGGNATLNGVVNRPFRKELKEGMTLYVNVRAVNEVGLSSPLLSSDGVAIGKSEVEVDNTVGSTMSLDTQYAAPSTPNATDDGTEGVDPNSGEEPPQTLAAVSFPPGAVDSSTSFVGGAVTPEDIAKGDAVNASETPPPAQNLKFGDYSFTLKAKDPDTGGVQEGFVFEKPIRISMLYSVSAILDGESAPTDWEPSLQIYDVATTEWIPAKLTCPEELQWDEVVHATRTYSVDICHLTTLALFYQLRPIAVVDKVFTPMEAASVVWTNSSATLQRLTAGDLSEHVPIVLVQLQRNAATGALTTPAQLTLDASRSYDPDGTVEHVLWNVRSPPGTLHFAERAAHVAATNATVSISHTSGTTTTVTPVVAGVGVVTVTVVDNTNGTRTKSTYFWFDEPPVAALGSSLPRHPPASPSGAWPGVLVHASVGDVATSVATVLNASASWDREGSPLHATWAVSSVTPRYAGASTTPVPQVGSPAGNNLAGVVTGLRAGTVATVALTVVTDDEAAAADTATTQVVVNALPVLVVDAPLAVFLPASNATFSIDRSVDLDGSIVRRSWTVAQTSGDSTGVLISNFSSHGTTHVTVTGVSGLAEFSYTVEVEDSDAGVVTSGVRRVVFKNPSAAIATPVTVTGAVVSPPSWDVMTPLTFNGSQSYDSDGPISSYAWTLHKAGSSSTEHSARFLAGSSPVATLVGGYSAGDYDVTLTVEDSALVPLAQSIRLRVLAVVDFAGRTHDGLLSVLSPAASVVITAAPRLHPNATVSEFAWTVTSAPVGCAPTLSTTASPTPSTTLSSLCGAGEYVVTNTLTVVDAAGSGGPYTVAGTITVVLHTPPVVDVVTSMRHHGQNVLTVVNRRERVDASASLDDRGSPAHFHWTGTSGVTFANASAAHTTMQVNAAGMHAVTVHVTDDVQEVQASTLQVRVLPSNVSAAVSPSIVRVVSTPPSFGAVQAAFDASATIAADSGIAWYQWAVSSTTHPTLSTSSATTQLVPHAGARDGNVSRVTLGGSPAPYDYTVAVTARDAAGATDTATATLRVLAELLPTPTPTGDVWAASSATTVRVAQHVAFHRLARQPQFVFTLASFAPLPTSVSPPPPPPHPGCVSSIGFVPTLDTAGTPGDTVLLQPQCGTGVYVVNCSVTVTDRGTTEVATAWMTRRVTVHDPPVPVMALDMPPADAALFAPIVTGGAWLTSVDNAVPLALSGAHSTDDVGVSSHAWAVVGVTPGPPFAPTGAESVNASGFVQAAGLDTSRLQLNFTAASVVTVQLTVTDVGGLNTSATRRVFVFATSTDLHAFRYPSSDSGSAWYLILIGVVLAVFLVAGVWLLLQHRSKKDKDNQTKQPVKEPTTTTTTTADDVQRFEPTLTGAVATAAPSQPLPSYTHPRAPSAGLPGAGAGVFGRRPASLEPLSKATAVLREPSINRFMPAANALAVPVLPVDKDPVALLIGAAATHVESAAVPQPAPPEEPRSVTSLFRVGDLRVDADAAVVSNVVSPPGSVRSGNSAPDADAVAALARVATAAVVTPASVSHVAPTGVGADSRPGSMAATALAPIMGAPVVVEPGLVPLRRNQPLVMMGDAVSSLVVAASAAPAQQPPGAMSQPQPQPQLQQPSNGPAGGDIVSSLVHSAATTPSTLPAADTNCVNPPTPRL